MPLTVTTPAQEHLVTDLLAWSRPRPPADPSLPAALLERLERGIAPAVATLPPDADVFVGAAGLEALVCEGRYLDYLDAPFRWTAASALGKLAHRAVEVDWKTDRSPSPATVVARVWEEIASDTGSLADYCNRLDAVDATRLRHDAEQLVTDVRDTWPVLPSSMQPRLEHPVRVTLAEGRVVMAGTPDLTLGRVRRDVCRMLLVDFKTGRRAPRRERDQLRFYALLLTLKYRVAPFRWAAYYVAEGAWEVEDLDPALLLAAADRVVAGVRAMVRLQTDPPPEHALRLQAGPACQWCGRRPTCPAARAAGWA